MNDKVIKKFKIDGMHCVSCAILIEGELEDQQIADKAECHYGNAELVLEAQKPIEDKKVAEIVEKLGYKATLKQ